MGGPARPPAHRPARSASWPGPTPGLRPSRRSRRSRSRCRPSTASRSAGRDSAGLHLLVRDHGLDLDRRRAPGAPRAPGRTTSCSASGAVRTPGGHLSFVYKAAAEIGELGDNTRRLRAAIADDELLRLALRSPTAEPWSLGHTRWASVGIISEANAHPLNSDEEGRPGEPRALRRSARSTATSTTTPTSRRPHGLQRRRRDHHRRQGHPHPGEPAARRAGSTLAEAFRATVASLRGLGRHRRPAPRRRRTSVLLALRGRARRSTSASPRTPSSSPASPTAWSRRRSPTSGMDGETPADLDNPNASRGQVVAPRRRRGRHASTGIERIAYDGTPLPVTGDELVTAQITTRDIDRGEHPPLPPQGDRRGAGARSARRCGASSSRPDGPRRAARRRHAARRRRRAGCADGTISRVMAIGQGTAAIAAQSLAAVLADLVADTGSASRPSPPPSCRASRCAPTCPTRWWSPSASPAPPPTPTAPSTSPAAAARTVIAIVNRRNSDLTDKADGVLYTSDGRDVEMSVPSTKAFYAQVAAGCLLAVAIADRVGGRRRRPDAIRCWPRCAGLPDAMAARARPAVRASAASPTSWPRRTATGRWSATDPTASPPRSCGSSSRSSATSRSPATSPRTRSTSTCRPSR